LWGAVSAGVAFGIGHVAALAPLRKIGAKHLLHGLSRALISKAQGGTFRAGFYSGFAASAFNPGTTIGGDGAGGFGLRTTMAGIVGGTASELGGGKFANGAVSGAFVHMFNAEMSLKRNTAWNTDGNGRLSLKEANRWWRVGHGVAIDVDASKLIVLDFKNRDIVFGTADYLAHGQVSLSTSGKIYDSWYDFDIKIKSDFVTGFRNAGTAIGQMVAGQGQRYETRFYNKPMILRLK